MATQICLPLWFLISTILHTLAHSENYIIHMDLSAMPKAFSSHHNWYKATLSSALDNSKATTDNNLNSISSKLIYSYNHVMNGFSANLSPAELETLKSSSGYISAIPDLPVRLHTTHSPQFLRLNPHIGAWPSSQYGKGVIIGVVDTGVWPESESFKDDGMTSVPSRWKGKCENSKLFNSSHCNKKLIGAKFFNKGLLAKNPKTTIKVNSTRDIEGHGTHTSSTAAGSQVYGASYFGYANGTATGMAPKAHVAVYKALWEDGAYSTDIIAAIDSAIEDGVDVLSLSFGFDERPLYSDPVAIATFAAMEKGIFVSTSSGNEGPSLQTLHNGTPWVITVAASKMDREFHGTLTLGNGVTITGLSLYPGDSFPPSNRTPIVFMGLCNDTEELTEVKDKIVVCEDKSRIIPDQVFKVDTARVLGAVFITNSTESLFFLQNRFPSIVVNPLNGEIVKGYIKGHSDPRARMSFKLTVFGTKPAPIVDSYSARGPSYGCPFVLKPDITAPGTLIVAAWPQKTPVGLLGSEKLLSKFNVISGTSMACPHITGLAALIKGAYPDWSPATIRSAMMTTSDVLDNTLSLIKDIGDDYKPATPLALGAGHVNPNKALDPGLVYNVEVQDYVNLLCALNFTKMEITAITRSSFHKCSNPSLDLNYPSFIAFINENEKSSGGSTTTHEFHRTVTNVGDGHAIYVASVTHIKGFNISVIPNKLVFKSKYEKLSYKLRIEGPKSMQKKIEFGYLTWKDMKHVVRSPIVITSMKIPDYYH